MSDLLFRPASELAGLVRSGELSARELVQASLDRIEALDPELNAFVDVYAEDALAAADAIGAGDERPFAGVPIAIKNNRAISGKRLTFAADFFGDWEAPYDHNVVRRFKEAGLRRRRIDDPARVGHPAVDQHQALRADAQPVGPDAHERRLLGRLGDGRRGRHGADRPRQRRRRLDAHPGRLLRPRRPQAPAQPHLAGAGDGRELPGRRRRAHADGRRHRSRPRPARRHRDRRRVVGAAAGRGLRRLRGARARGPARGGGDQRADRRTARAGARGGRPRGRAPARVARAPRRGGAGAVARGQPAAGLHRPLRPARDASDRVRPARPGPRARIARDGANELGPVGARARHVGTRHASRLGPAADLRPRPA